MKCLENVGMLSTTPIEFEGHQIVPIKFLKALLPDPASLGPRTKGKTNIGCIFTGKKDGKEKTYYIYNVCDHQECYKRGGQPGHQLHHRRARHVRRADAANRQVEQARRTTPWRSLIPIPSWMRWISTDCPEARAMRRLWWTDGSARN